MEYRLIRTSRRTVSLSVTDEGIVVRAPARMPKRDIDMFVESRRGWIDKQLERRRELSGIEPLTKGELSELAGRAASVIPERAAYFAPMVGVRYGRITIRAQRTRWGSCSPKGNLSFNLLLVLAPPEVLDSVVVHELCHLKELNHSRRFYDLVLSVYPEYHRWNGWLKVHGDELMARLGPGA